MREGAKECLFLSTVHAQGIKTVHEEGGVKQWQNSVHVVVECPPRIQGKCSRVPLNPSLSQCYCSYCMTHSCAGAAALGVIVRLSVMLPDKGAKVEP